MLASLMRLESWLKASAQLGFMEADQLEASLILELNGPSCEAVGEVSSIDVSSCGSGKECHLFGHGDCLGSGLGEAVVDGCPSTRDALVNGMDRGDEGNYPNKMW